MVTDSRYTPPLAAQKVLAKAALNTLRTRDHTLGRPLALCLMFEAAENQAMAASVFDLAISLDAALHIPSEAMLATIRIQWWADELNRSINQQTALLAQLQAQFQIRNGFQLQLQGMIAVWQAACNDKNRDSVAGWVQAWRLIAIQLGHIKAADKAAEIGNFFHHAMHGRKGSEHNAINNQDVTSLRRNDQGDVRSWLYLAGCLNRRIQQNLVAPNSKNMRESLDDPLLVWRILNWQLFGPPR